MTTMDGRPYSVFERSMLASNGHLHKQVRAFVFRGGGGGPYTYLPHPSLSASRVCRSTMFFSISPAPLPRQGPAHVGGCRLAVALHATGKAVHIR